MRKLLFLLIIPLLIFNSCEEEEKDSLNIAPVLVHHQIIIENSANLEGSFYLHAVGTHNYFLTPSETVPIIDGTFGTPLGGWAYGQLPYSIMFQYIGNSFGCVGVTINTFVEFEFYHTINFVIGKVNDELFCEWNGNIFSYEIIIE